MGGVPNSSPTSVATASGWLALLQEPDVALRNHALVKLLDCVDTLWHEVAESLPDLEAVAEDTDLPLEMRQTAAAVASRVFFHLEEPSQALRLALEAGEAHFNVSKHTPYEERLVSAALDAYIQGRRRLDDEEMAAADDNIASLPLDQLQGLVFRLIETCCAEEKYQHALGIALEARETEKVRHILAASKGNVDILKYALQAAVNVVTVKAFRQETLAVIAEALSEQLITRKTAAVDLVLVHQLLGQPASVAGVLSPLLMGTEEDCLLGYQLCFDLVDSGDQAFVQGVADSLQTSFAESSDDIKARCDQALKVLTGGFSSELALSFLYKHSNADRLIMENLKKGMDERGGGGRNSILHNAAVVTHGYLYAGTTNDSFLRDYLDWMKKAANWYVHTFRLLI